MNTLPDGQIDPRTWAGEYDHAALASVVRLELERARVEAAPPPKPPSPWTPTAVTTLLTTVGGIITAIIVSASQLMGSGEQTRVEVKAAIEAHAKVEQVARDEITTRLGTAEQRAAWAAAGVCALNGAPLHETQPAECVATVQRDPVKVPKAYP